MPSAVDVLEATAVALDLIEAHARQITRAKAISQSMKSIMRVMRARWRAQLKAILDSENLKSLYSQKESISSALAEMIMRLMLPQVARKALEGFVSDEEIKIFDGALTLAFGAGALTASIELHQLFATMDLAADERRWIETRGFEKLARDIDMVTRERLRDAVAKAYQDGGSYEDLVRTIKSTFRDFSDQRADLIAQTELNAAYNRGGLDFAKRVNAQRKRWNPLGDNVCPICVANEAQGWVKITSSFQGGADSPPQHPRCQCVVDFGFAPIA